MTTVIWCCGFGSEAHEYKFRGDKGAKKELLSIVKNVTAGRHKDVTVCLGELVTTNRQEKDQPFFIVMDTDLNRGWEIQKLLWEALKRKYEVFFLQPMKSLPAEDQIAGS